MTDTMLCSRRLPSFNLKAVTPGLVSERYVDIEDALRRSVPKEQERKLCMALLLSFTMEVSRQRKARTGEPANNVPDDDLTQLNGSRDGVEDAVSAFCKLSSNHHWTPRHEKHMRTLLSHTLLLVITPLAHAVNPVMRAKDNTARIDATRSHESTFTLLECLPIAVRSLHPRDIVFRLMDKIGRKLVDSMRSVSKGHLQKVLLFIHHLLFDSEPDGQCWAPLLPDDVDMQWSNLCAKKPLDWLQRYERIIHGEHVMGLSLFKRHMHVISTLYGCILNPGSRDSMPLPRAGGIKDAKWYDAASSGGGSSTFSTSGSCTEDERGQQKRTQLRDTMNRIRRRVCNDGCSGPNHIEQVFSFSPEEVRKIIAAAHSTVERLVVWLFLTTGLRIGGLARLRTGVGPYTWGKEVPRTASTVEKNGRERLVPIGAAGRILIARWYKEDRGNKTSQFLFPGRVDGSHSASTHWIWLICHRVFNRAELDKQQGHLHPHTFRHTFIHYMYMSGASFETIAKFIGHRTPAITSGVYGRLRQIDIESSTVGLPWLKDEGVTNTKEEWVSLGKLLLAPWTFSPDEWIGLRQATPAAANETRARGLESTDEQKAKKARRRALREDTETCRQTEPGV